MLRIPNFQATFNADGTILSMGPAALDTLVRVSNESSVTKVANVGFWNEHEEGVLDLNIALKSREVQTFSVAALLRGDDPRALPCPHLPDPPRYFGPFPTAFLFQHLCRLSQHRQPPNSPVDGILVNPLHGYITIDDLHSNGKDSGLRAEYVVVRPSFITNLDPWLVEQENSLRAKYVIVRPHSFITNLDARLVELTGPADLPVVYSRPSWRGLGVVLEETQMNVRGAIRLIESHGWIRVATKGSHRQYKHPQKPGRVTIPGNLNDDLAPGTFNSILKQAGLKP